MANIDTYLQQILAAIYGEDVRGSIHDAIQEINNVVQNWESGLMDTTLTSTTLPAQGKAVGDAVENIANRLNELIEENTIIVSASQNQQIKMKLNAGDKLYIKNSSAGSIHFTTRDTSWGTQLQTGDVASNAEMLVTITNAANYVTCYSAGAGSVTFENQSLKIYILEQKVSTLENTAEETASNLEDIESQLNKLIEEKTLIVSASQNQQIKMKLNAGDKLYIKNSSAGAIHFTTRDTSWGTQLQVGDVASNAEMLVTITNAANYVTCYSAGAGSVTFENQSLKIYILEQKVSTLENVSTNIELINLCEENAPTDNYYINRNTGLPVSNESYSYFTIPVKNGVTYYYANLFPYFGVIYDGRATVTQITDNTYNHLSGSFTAPYDGELRITVLKSNKTNCVVSESPLTLVNSEEQSIAVTDALIYPYTFIVGNNEIYKRIRDAVSEAIKYKNSTVIIRSGTYDLISEFSDEIVALENGAETACGITLENGVHLLFESGTIVNALYTGNSENVTTYFNPFRAGVNGGGFTLENLNIRCRATRYCVHDELAGLDVFSKNNYINCFMEIDSVNAPVVGYVQCIGGGCGKHTYVNINNCYFKSKRAETVITPLVSYHNGNNPDAFSNINVQNSFFADKGTFRCTYYGNSTKISKAVLQNCSLGAAPIIRHEIEGATTPENFEIIAFMNEIRV